MANLETPEERRIRLDKISRFIRAHHMKRLKATWPLSFYVRSHHHPSIPWLYHDFNNLDLATVTRYRVVVQSVCMKMVGGQVDEREIKRDEIYIDVQ